MMLVQRPPTKRRRLAEQMTDRILAKIQSKYSFCGSRREPSDTPWNGGDQHDIAIDGDSDSDGTRDGDESDNSRRLPTMMEWNTAASSQGSSHDASDPTVHQLSNSNDWPEPSEASIVESIEVASSDRHRRQHKSAQGTPICVSQDLLEELQRLPPGRVDDGSDDSSEDIYGSDDIECVSIQGSDTHTDSAKNSSKASHDSQIDSHNDGGDSSETMDGPEQILKQKQESHNQNASTSTEQSVPYSQYPSISSTTTTAETATAEAAGYEGSDATIWSDLPQWLRAEARMAAALRSRETSARQRKTKSHLYRWLSASHSYKHSSVLAQQRDAVLKRPHVATTRARSITNESSQQSSNTNVSANGNAITSYFQRAA